MQSKTYIKEDADKWYERNTNHTHNCFTEYLLNLFPKKILKEYKVAEFGVGRATNINYLSNFVKKIDGYDGSKKAIMNLKKLKEQTPNIDGKIVNLADEFEAIETYDIIIYGFFTYMVSDKEFKNVVSNTKRIINKNGYIFIYDFLSTTNKSSQDSHNKELQVFKRNLDFYLQNFKDFYLIDFRLFDNRNLNEYLLKENIKNIDINLDDDDYHWTFGALFKLK